MQRAESEIEQAEDGLRAGARRPACQAALGSVPGSRGRRLSAARGVLYPVGMPVPSACLGEQSQGHGRAAPCRAPDHLRHLHPRRARRRGGLRQGLAAVARHRRARPRPRRPAVLAADVGAAEPRRGAGGDLARPPRRGTGPARAVQPARRGRPADRPRRLRHEGRSGGDDVRAGATRPPSAKCACASSASPTRSPRRSRTCRPTRWWREGFRGDFAITGEPTDMHIGIEAKGVLALRLSVSGRRRTAPRPGWATTRSSRRVDVFRAIESLPFSRESLGPVRPPLDQPGTDPGRGRAQQGPRHLLDRRRRALPARAGRRRDPRAGARAGRRRGACATFIRPPASVSRTDPYVGALREAVGRSTRGEVLSVGRDGASDAVAFLDAGIPAVEFGPVGGGSPRPGRVGVDLLAGALPPGARRLRAPSCPPHCEAPRRCARAEGER